MRSIGDDEISDLKHRLLSNAAEQPGPLATPCLVWTGPTLSKGYGRLYHNRTHVLVHRAAYECFVGPIPEGMQINHHCDNPGCIRPEHLYCGTAEDNTRDMYERGRAHIAVGSEASNARLTEENVKEVFEMLREGYSQVFIAEYFGVGGTTIHSIANGRTWTHVPGCPSRRRKRKSVGVRWQDGRWMARITVSRKRKYLGLHQSELDAAKTYNFYALAHNLNRPLNVIEKEIVR
jgi:HNH endonuclease